MTATETPGKPPRHPMLTRRALGTRLMRLEDVNGRAWWTDVHWLVAARTHPIGRLLDEWLGREIAEWSLAKITAPQRVVQRADGEPWEPKPRSLVSSVLTQHRPTSIALNRSSPHSWTDTDLERRLQLSRQKAVATAFDVTYWGLCAAEGLTPKLGDSGLAACFVTSKGRIDAVLMNCLFTAKAEEALRDLVSAPDTDGGDQ